MEKKHISSGSSIQDSTSHTSDQLSTRSPGRTKENYRKIYEEAYGEIPRGYHIHHIDGNSHNNHPDNLVALSPEDHYDIHFEQGDLGACALLSDGIDREAPTVPVVQFTLDGHRVKVWECQTEIEEVTGIHQGSINACCQYKQKSRGGYQWYFLSEVGDTDYIGPREGQNKGGHDTSGQSIIINGIKYKSKAEAAKLIFPKYAHRTDGGQLRKEFKDLLKKNGYSC